MVDRDDAVATVREAMAAAASGAGRALFVVGEAGMGKTRLVTEAAAMADAARLTVLRGRAVERALPPPFRPLIEALQPAFTQTAVDDGPAGPHRSALRSLLTGELRAAGEAGELAVAESLARFLGAVGRSAGCLLILEDLHWADPETLAVVEYLADHLAGQPALVLASVRAGEASPAERLSGLLRERRAAGVVPLRRLGGEATDRMLAACLGSAEVPPEVGRFVQEHADGVPLFVEELLAGLADSGALVRSGDGWHVAAALSPVVPLTYGESIRRRLDSLPDADHDMVVAAAVLGRRFRWSLLPSTTGRDEASVVASLRRVVDSQLLECDDELESFRFRHALTRDAVLGELLPPEHAAIAARALVALDASRPGPAGAGDDLDLVAELAERAGDRPRAVDALVAAAQAALRHGALVSARAALERAAWLARPHPELSILVEETSAHAAALSGDVDDAIRRAALVLAGLPDGDASAGRGARLHLTLARAATVAGRWADATRHVADALTLAPGADSSLRAGAEALAAQVAIGAGRTDEAECLARSALVLATSTDAAAAACEALEVLGRLARTSDVDEGERLFAEALAVADRHGLGLWRARALHELGTIDLYGGRGTERMEAARAAAVGAGAVSTVALCDLHLTAGGYARWEAKPGIAAGRSCVDLSRRLGLDTLGMGLVHLATCHAVAGDAEEMEAVLAEAARFATSEPDVAVGIPGRARMALAVRMGDLGGARAALDDATARLRRHPESHFPFRGLWALLRSVEEAGDEGASARAEVATAKAGGAVFNSHCLALAEAVALGRQGRGQEAAGDLDHHLDGRWIAAHGPWAAVALAALGSAALRDGWGDGERWVRLPLACFEGRGLDELASWCRAVLRGAGRPVPRRGRGSGTPPPDLRALGVTSREVDVLRLLATGASNKEIADRLHLSPRTVERHVSNLLTKTGATDRRGLGLLDTAGGAG